VIKHFDNTVAIPLLPKSWLH